jgi:DNA-binding MarR family transcriptional regulator
MAENSPFQHNKADDSPGFLLWKLNALWQARLGETFRGYGITQTQYAILASLRWLEHTGEPTTQTQLARHAKIDKMTLSKAIRRLEQADLIERANSATDNRATNVSLTMQGRELTHKAVIAIETDDETFFSALSAEERETFKFLTLRLIHGNTLKRSDRTKA